MNVPRIDYSEKVVILKSGGHSEMCLGDAIRLVMQLGSLEDRLACTIMRRDTPMQYPEIVRIFGRGDFPRLAVREAARP